MKPSFATTGKGPQPMVHMTRMDERKRPAFVALITSPPCRRPDVPLGKKGLTRVTLVSLSYGLVLKVEVIESCDYNFTTMVIYLSSFPIRKVTHVCI